MPDTTETGQVYELSDVDVLSVGLVTRGANREEFFLVKSEDGTPEEDIPAPKPNLWERIKAFVKGAVEAEVEAQFPEDEMPGESEEEPGVVVPGPTSEETPATKTEAGDKESAGASAPEETPMAEETQVKETEKGAQPPATVKWELPPELMAQIAKIGALEAKAAKVDGLEAKLVQVEKERDAEKELREKQEYVEKAAGYIALPTKASELADHLYKLAKAAPEEAKWFEALLNAADNALVTAGIFKEYGTSTSPETMTALEKAENMVTKGEAKDIAEAMLKLTPAEQATILNESRARAGKK